MNSRLQRIIFFSCLGMTASWLQAWNTFIMKAFSESPVPLVETIVVLYLAIAIAAILKLKSRPRIFIGAAHAAGLLFSFALFLHTPRTNFPFWNPDWILQVAASAWGLKGWLLAGWILVFSLLCWYAGLKILSHGADRLAVKNFFDTGLGAFFVMFMIKMMAATKSVEPVFDPFLIVYFFAFTILGLFSMGAARNMGGPHMPAVTYAKGIGTVLSFVVLTLVFGIGFLMLFLPEMLKGANLGHHLFSEVLRHSANWLILFFKLVQFKKTAAMMAKGVEAPKEASSSFHDTEIRESPLVGHMIIFVSMALACFLLWLFIRWLFSKPPSSLEEKGPWALCRHYLQKWAERIGTLVQRLMQGAKDRHRGPDLFFRCLVHWGARSGLPRLNSETPKEYGGRLVRFFPNFRREIEGIVEQFNRFKYGRMALDDVQLSSLISGWNRLRSPKLWPLRLKLLLFHAKGS